MSSQPEVIVAGQVEQCLTGVAWLEAPAQAGRLPLGGSLREPAEGA
jgi:hypothetical protein